MLNSFSTATGKKGKLLEHTKATNDNRNEVPRAAAKAHNSMIDGSKTEENCKN
jgi:hypothetical protein